MLDLRRLKAARVLRKANVAMPRGFAEWDESEQGRFIDKAIASLQSHQYDASKRRLLDRHGLLPVPSPCSDQWANERFQTMPQQPPIDGLIAVTSLSPNPDRLLVQRVCLTSWMRLGLRVVAVQHREEIPALAPHFPGVEFVESTRRHSHKPNVLIKDLADVLVSQQVSGLLINSDIEIRAKQEEFLANWIPKPGVHTIGIRTNYEGDRSEIEPNGLDVFLLTPDMAADLPELEFAIGAPFWDYWLPHHFRTLGYSIEARTESVFWHRRHELFWDNQDWKHHCDIFRTAYNLQGFEIKYFRETLLESEANRIVRVSKTTAIFIKTYPGDHEWLKFCLRSIQKYTVGFAEIVIVADEAGRKEIEGWGLTQEKVAFVPDPPNGHGYIQQQIVKLNADKYTDCDHILFMDSDCIFTKPCSPASFFDNGRPLWLKGRYDQVGIADRWKPITEAALGHSVDWEYMRRQPFVLHRETLARFRAAHPDALPRMQQMTGDDCSEFNMLGAFAERTEPYNYAFVDNDKHDPERLVEQFWSWGGITDEIRQRVNSALD